MNALLLGTVMFCLLGQALVRGIDFGGSGGPPQRILGKTPDKPPILVGIVEANGNLFPIASFDGSSWKIATAASLAGRPMEWTLWYETQPPVDWQSWIRRLKPTKTEFTSTGLYGEIMYCETLGMGISTDLGDRSASLIESKHNCPEPKVGIATTGKSPPMLAEALDLHGGEARRLLEAITDRFNLMEDQASARVIFNYTMGNRKVKEVKSWGNAAARQQIPLEGVKLFQFQRDDRTLYYIEARRRFPVPEEVTFPTSSYLIAWAVEVDGELAWISEGVKLRGSDTRGLDDDTPIAFWPTGSTVDVLVRRTGWEDEDYLIINVTPEGIYESSSADHPQNQMLGLPTRVRTFRARGR